MIKKYVIVAVLNLIGLAMYAQAPLATLFTQEDTDAWIVEGYYKKICSTPDADTIMTVLDEVWRNEKLKDTTGFFLELEEFAALRYAIDVESYSTHYWLRESRIPILYWANQTKKLLVLYNTTSKHVAITNSQGIRETRPFMIVRPGGILSYYGGIGELSILTEHGLSPLTKETL